jgi:hypothetical protein
MPNKQMLALPLILVMTLSLTGIAFASWTETLNFTGSVTTARLNLRVSNVFPPIEVDPIGVGSVSVDPVGSLGGNVKTITLTVENAYPGYSATVAITVENTGTIPAHFVGFKLNDNPASYSKSLGWKDSLGAIDFQGWDSEGLELPVGATHSYTLTLTVTGEASPDTDYTFTVGIVFEQGV